MERDEAGLALTVADGLGKGGMAAACFPLSFDIEVVNADGNSRAALPFNSYEIGYLEYMRR